MPPDMLPDMEDDIESTLEDEELRLARQAVEESMCAVSASEARVAALYRAYEEAIAADAAATLDAVAAVTMQAVDVANKDSPECVDGLLVNNAVGWKLEADHGAQIVSGMVQQVERKDLVDVRKAADRSDHAVRAG